VLTGWYLDDGDLSNGVDTFLSDYTSYDGKLALQSSWIGQTLYFTKGFFDDAGNLEKSWDGTSVTGIYRVGQITAASNINDTPTGSVTITGTATKGSTLALSDTIADADGLGSFTYQWLRDGSEISGATSSTYVLSQTDVGTNISASVSYTDDYGTAEIVTSEATDAIANVNDTPTGSVTITGTVSKGETLTADTSGLSDPDTLSSFNFVWLRDGTPISGAIASSYGLTQEDVGAQISMQVSYTDGGGTLESVTSDPTQAVTNINDDTFEGNDGDNTLSGGDGADKISGGLGNDTITASPSNDLMDGGEGIDTAIYSGNLGNYKLTLGPSSTIMTDRTGTEGTDTLVDIEKLTFADRTLDLDNYSSLTQLNDTQFSDLAKVYVAYFNRAADAEGLYFWADKLAEGMDMATIASYFSQSAEAKALYPDTANTSAFVTAVYANVLGRTPDQAGFDFWTTTLNNGSMQPATFVLSIIGGAQGADITYLSNKADLGVYFSAIKGMSDGVDAQNVLNIFGDQSTSNTAGAKASVDGHFTDATASGSGEFIFELVGIVNDPFAGVI
jgi:hypothetical protein